jgi:adenylate cyclase
VAFDFDFSTPDIDRLETDGAESDRHFSDAIARSGRVVLGTTLFVREEGDQRGGRLLHHHLRHPTLPAGDATVYDRATAPLPPFQSAAAMIGVTNFTTDEDGIARRTSLMYPFADGALPQFAVAAYALASGNPTTPLDSLVLFVPRDHQGRMVICWYGRGGPGGVFRHYSVHSLIISGQKISAGLPPDVDPALFKGKHVIVGGSAPGLWDLKPTPFTSLEAYPGAEIQATILSNLLRGHYIRVLPPWVGHLLSLLLAAGVGLTLGRGKRVAISSLAAIGLTIAFACLALVVFHVWFRWIPVVEQELAAVATFAIASAGSYALEGQQKRHIRKAFTRYLSPHVVAEILENPDQIDFGGKLVEATVFFSDIKDFTTVAESLSPKELVTFLNDYFSLASDLILKHEGMLDKYIGDAIMAIFGAPVTHADHARQACLAALEIQNILQAYRQRPERPEGEPDFVTRVGLHTGSMIVGNIGSRNHLDYTAIGDTVNLASRLEGVNKYFGTHIILSQTTREAAGDDIAARPLDFIRVKGKKEPIRIYELVGQRPQLSQEQLDTVEMFSSALATYRSREFVQARRRFEEILRLNAEDVAAQVYIRRCRELEEQPPAEDWDGVYTMTSK